MALQEERVDEPTGDQLSPSVETPQAPADDKLRCPNHLCQYDKHEEAANFCILCGTLLYTHCEDCLANNPRYAKFCYYCGADLNELREAKQLDEQ